MKVCDKCGETSGVVEHTITTSWQTTIKTETLDLCPYCHERIHKDIQSLVNPSRTHAGNHTPPGPIPQEVDE